MRRLLLLPSLLLLVISSQLHAAEKPLTLDLWPGTAPGEKGDVGEEKVLPPQGGQTPPTFFAHAGDDKISSENSVAVYLALKRAKVPAELHVYASGGHGFGLRPSDNPCSTWPQRCEQWMRNRGLLEK